jgi:hypothetical protein
VFAYSLRPRRALIGDHCVSGDALLLVESVCLAPNRGKPAANWVLCLLCSHLMVLETHRAAVASCPGRGSGTIDSMLGYASNYRANKWSMLADE